MLLEVDRLAENCKNGENLDLEGEQEYYSRDAVLNNLFPSSRDRFLEDENDYICNIDFFWDRKTK